MNKNLLIVGVDPGTTLAYAILDVNGNLIKLRSSKNLNLSRLIFDTIRYGKIIVVGCDVCKVPSFVQEYAIKIGAKIICPKEDLGVREKRGLVRGKVKNRHQRDALASAIFAHKKIKNLLTKIDNYVKEKNKEEYADKIKELLLTKNGLNIERALKSLEE